MPDNVLRMHHDPNRTSNGTRTIRMTHQEGHVVAQTSTGRTLRLESSANLLHTKYYAEKGITGIRVRKPEYCINKCRGEFHEVMQDGVPKWQCDTCGAIF